MHRHKSIKTNLGEPATPLERLSTSRITSSSVTPADQCLSDAFQQQMKTPHKKKAKRSQSRKKLFKNNTLETMTKEVKQLFPGFLQKLHSANLCYLFCTFIKLVCNGKFPLTNISLLLFLDVVQWYSLAKTTMMTYTDDTMKFWRVIYKLFHGKVLRFLSGVKSIGHGTNITPETTSINFAVPSVSVINEYSPQELTLPKVVNPGIIEDVIKLRPTDQYYILSMDGKKLAPGLSSEKGDIDLLGFEENGDTLEAAKSRLKNELNQVRSCSENWSSLSDNDKVEKVISLVKVVSNRIRDLRTVFLTLSKALSKFQLSSIQCSIFQIKSLIQRLLEVNDGLLEIGASVDTNLTMDFVSGSNRTIDAFEQHNWVSLKEIENLPANLKDKTEFMKQRSQEWFDLRKQFLLTGSRLYEALGLDTLKRLNQHIDKLKNPSREIEPVSAEVQKNLERVDPSRATKPNI